MIVLPANEGPPVEEESNAIDQEASADDLLPEVGVAFFFEAGHDEGHGVADGEEEERKNKVGGREAVPLGMFEGAVDVIPGAGIIY